MGEASPLSLSFAPHCMEEQRRMPCCFTSSSLCVSFPAFLTPAAPRADFRYIACL